MKRIKLLNWILELDAPKTRAYYENLNESDGCSCAYCENYRKNCNYFSQEVLDFYNSLGIDPKKEGEFMEFKLDKNKHLYSGFYHIVGKINSGSKDIKEGWDKNIIILDKPRTACLKCPYSIRPKRNAEDALRLVPKNQIGDI
jgi:hypothetical protein